jgi:hypothetical protein
MVEHHRSKSGSFGIIRDDDFAILLGSRIAHPMRFANRSKEQNEENEDFIHLKYLSLFPASIA